MASRIAEEAGWPRERLDRDYNARATIPVAAYEAEMLRYRAMSDAARESHATHLDVVYDEESGQALDIFGTAAGELRPVFVFIHGGCWESAYSLDHASYLSSALANAGYVVWMPEYRRLGDAGAGWPGTFEDVAMAVDYVRELAPNE